MFDFLISRIKDYIALDDKEIQLIESLFVKEEYGRNEVILQEGEVCRKFFFVAKGILRLAKNVNGIDRTFVFRTEGSFGSIMESFCTRFPSPNSINTTERCILYTITYDNLQVFYTTIREGERFGRLLIEEVFMEVSEHLVAMHSLSPEQRYTMLTISEPTMLERIPQYMIASYLGITPQALCRIKKKMNVNNN
ncbi:MAG: Crp/Fnr family transcriptional regulator [Bacteroidetes bacterium]|nr:MAG: Crp/Fnr family transcriptional regulator [Bacteroidota bacterium]